MWIAVGTRLPYQAYDTITCWPALKSEIESALSRPHDVPAVTSVPEGDAVGADAEDCAGILAVRSGSHHRKTAVVLQLLRVRESCFQRRVRARGLHDPLELTHHLAVRGLGEEIHGLDTSEAVAVAQEELGVAGERAEVAGDVNDVGQLGAGHAR